MAADFLERMGAQIRARRDEMGLSRAEVARRMPGKVNENQVYRWEKGLHQPNPDTLDALARVLETTVAALMAPPQEPEKAATPDALAALADSLPPALDDRLSRIEEKLERLLKEDRKRYSALSKLDRELLAQFDAVIQRLGRDIGRGQPLSRGGRSSPPDTDERVA